MNDTKRIEQKAKEILFSAGIESDVLPDTLAALNSAYAPAYTPLKAPDVAAVADQLISHIQNDAGNADCMQLLYGNQIRYCHTRCNWFHWNGQRWAADRNGEAQRLARETAKARFQAAAKMPTDTEEQQAAKKRFSSFAISSEGARQVELTLKSASNLKALATTVDIYDADPMSANAGAVTIDLKTCAARENRQQDYITKRLGADYDPQAKSLRWNQFLGEVFNHDAELIAYIQRAVGYTLTGDTSEHKFFLCHGAGANGKSIFLNTLYKLMGEYAGTTPFETLDADTAESRQDLAKLYGTRFVSVIETDEDRRLAEARVKKVTGGDFVTGRELYANPFDYKPVFKLWVAMNHKPLIRGTDRGIWRRIALIPFAQSFEGREDRKLEGKLETELPGILNWALAGLKAWHAQGLGSCSTIEKATGQYRQESDIIGQWIAECAEIGPNFNVESGDAYRSYVAWCERVGQKKYTETRNSWARRMSERDGITRREGHARKSFYWGIGLIASE